MARVSSVLIIRSTNQKSILQEKESFRYQIEVYTGVEIYVSVEVLEILQIIRIFT